MTAPPPPVFAQNPSNKGLRLGPQWQSPVFRGVLAAKYSSEMTYSGKIGKPRRLRGFSVWLYFHSSRAGKLVRQWEIHCFVWLMPWMGLTRMEARPAEWVRLCGDGGAPCGSDAGYLRKRVLRVRFTSRALCRIAWIVIDEVPLW